MWPYIGADCHGRRSSRAILQCIAAERATSNQSSPRASLLSMRLASAGSLRAISTARVSASRSVAFIRARLHQVELVVVAQAFVRLGGRCLLRAAGRVELQHP